MPDNAPPGPAGVGDETETYGRGPVGSGTAGPLDYDSFKKAVLARQIRNARAAGKTFYPPVPKEQLEKIEGGHSMRAEAERKCRELLAGARNALEEAKAKNDASAMRTSAIGIGSS